MPRLRSGPARQDRRKRPPDLLARAQARMPGAPHTQRDHPASPEHPTERLGHRRPPRPTRRNGAFYLLGLSLVPLLVADTLYGLLQLGGVWRLVQNASDVITV